MPISRRTFTISGLIAVAAIITGAFLGTVSVPEYEFTSRRATSSDIPESEEATKPDHKVRFLASLKSGAQLPAVAEELRLARSVGLTDFIFDIDLPRDDEETRLLKTTITKFFVQNTTDTFWLSVDCGVPAPGTSSIEWIEETKAHLVATTDLFKTKQKNEIFTGIILNKVGEGSTLESDESTRQFQLWLQAKYLSIENLSQAWGESAPETWETVTIPSYPDDTAALFIDPATQSSLIDFKLYSAESNAALINQLAAHLRESTHEGFKIFTSANELQYHLDPELIDGLTTASTRMSLPGIATTPPPNGLTLIHTDPFFTGVQFDAEEDAPRVPAKYDRSILAQDMTRNAMITAIAGDIWAVPDPQGIGAFTYEPVWRDIAKLIEARIGIIGTHNPPGMTPITLVHDPYSMQYIQNSRFFNTLTLDTLESTLKSGFPFERTTLADLHARPDDSLPVYIFPDLIKLSAVDRAALHETLVRQKATAIWLYTSGIIDETLAIENTTALTGVQLETRAPELTTGSHFAFSGEWIEEEETYGEKHPGIPTFRVTDEQADPLARYQDNDDISTAMKFHESGWTSIVLLDPTLTPEFIKDLIYILGTPVDITAHVAKGDPLIVRIGNNLVLHSDDDAEVRLEINLPYTAVNLLDTEEAWYNRDDITLQLTAGDTKLLHFEAPQDTP